MKAIENDLQKLLLCLEWDLSNIEDLNAKKDYLLNRLHHIQEVQETEEKSKPTERDRKIEHLSHYVSEDDVTKAYDRLMDVEDDLDTADDHVLMWEPLENKYTVAQLLDLL